MRSLFVAVLIFCLAFVGGILGLSDFFIGTKEPAPQALLAEGAMPGTEPAMLQRALVGLMSSPQQEVRLGAMLLSVRVADPDNSLAVFIRKSRSPEDGPLARTVKNYALAYPRASTEDVLRFVREFPDDPAGFLELIRFDTHVMGQSVGGVMVELFVGMTSCQETDATVREAARSRLPALRVAQDKSGFAAEILPAAVELCE